MEVFLEPASDVAIAASFWRHPAAWLREKNLSRGYWVFFSAAFFFDAGFAIYFFLFNLYLLDYRFNERAMGWIGGAMTLGSLVGTLPAGALAQKIGLRPLLIVLFVTAPLVNAIRAVWVWEPAQIGLAFLVGLAMSSWGVCFLPGIARLTTEKNRTAGFSLIFSASVGTSMLGGVVCGYLRQWLGMAGFAMRAADVKRVILLGSCAIVFVGLIPVLRLRIPSQPKDETGLDSEAHRWSWLRAWKLNPFLWRFLPLMALWSAVLAAFTPFANVYLTRELHIQMTQIGLIFSTVQVLQLFTGLLVPFVIRALGLVKGIAAMQMIAAVVLGLLAGTRSGSLAVGLYLTFSAALWMSSPALYNLLMNETPDAERSAAAAMTLFCNALAGSVATAAAGILLTRFGYPPVLLSLAIVALAIALLFRFLLAPPQQT
jgi:predicted MFS family arabinose efflux permease